MKYNVLREDWKERVSAFLAVKTVGDTVTFIPKLVLTVVLLPLLFAAEAGTMHEEDERVLQQLTDIWNKPIFKEAAARRDGKEGRK